MVNIIQGNINPGEVKKSIRLIKKKKNLKFIPWAPSSIKIILTRQSPLIQHQHRVSGLMIANHTNMSSLFKEIIKSYNYLKRRNAFIDNFTKFRIFNDDLEEFNSCKEIVEILIDEYTAMLKSNYVS